MPADWLEGGLKAVDQAASLGPRVESAAWDKAVVDLRASYRAGTCSENEEHSRRARKRLERLDFYADWISAAARKSIDSRVPYRVRAAHWSGRLVIEAPIWQAVTKDGDGALRRAVVARPGARILRADWHASQLYLLAGLSGDKALAADLASGDPHQRIGDALGAGYPPGQRRALGKLANFAILYRAGPDRLVEGAASKGIQLARSQAHAMIGSLRRRYSHLWSWGQSVQRCGRHLLWTPGGRRVQLRPDRRCVGGNAGPPPAALPTVLAGIGQAWEADALLWSLSVLAAAPECRNARLLLHLHDCTIWEVAAEDAEGVGSHVARVMQEAHAWVQRCDPRPGAAPTMAGGSRRAGAPVKWSIADSWGGPGAFVRSSLST